MNTTDCTLVGRRWQCSIILNSIVRQLLNSVPLDRRSFFLQKASEQRRKSLHFFRVLCAFVVILYGGQQRVELLIKMDQSIPFGDLVKLTSISRCSALMTSNLNNKEENEKLQPILQVISKKRVNWKTVTLDFAYKVRPFSATWPEWMLRVSHDWQYSRSDRFMIESIEDGHILNDDEILSISVIVYLVIRTFSKYFPATMNLGQSKLIGIMDSIEFRTQNIETLSN